MAESFVGRGSFGVPRETDAKDVGIELRELLEIVILNEMVVCFLLCDCKDGASELIYDARLAYDVTYVNDPRFNQPLAMKNALVKIFYT